MSNNPGLFSTPQKEGSAFSFGNSSNKPTFSFGSENGGLFGKPNENKTASGGLFGSSNENKTASGGLFGNVNDKSAANGGLFGKPNENKTANGGLFGKSNGNNTANGGLFSSSNNTIANGEKSNTASGSLFGNSNNTASTANLFGDKKDDKPASTGFSFGKPAEKNDNKPANTGFSFGKPAESDNKPASTGFSFGKPAEKNDNKPANTGFSFGKPAEKKDDKPANTGFSFGAKPDDKKDDKPASSGFSFGKPAEKNDNKPTDKNDKKSVSFGSLTKTTTEDKKDTVTATADAAKATPVTVSPDPVSLENQTVQDMIKNWANKLSTCQGFFDSYSGSINKWDRILTDNSEKLSKLYTNVLETEQLSSNIDQSLLYLEKQQDDIESFLNSYENKINDIYEQDDSILLGVNDSNNLVSNGNANRLANDKKREAAYSNAIMLDESLDTLTTDLTTLISDINDVSETFNNTIYKNSNIDQNDESASENNISSIIKLMNNHLNSLKWLESNSEVLKNKIDSYKSL